jgi:hypothetical protein
MATSLCTRKGEGDKKFLEEILLLVSLPTLNMVSEKGCAVPGLREEHFEENCWRNLLLIVNI